jgi:hypothetical protein
MVIPRMGVVLSKLCSLAIASSQPIEYKKYLYGIFEKKHYMECTTLTLPCEPGDKLVAPLVINRMAHRLWQGSCRDGR